MKHQTHTKRAATIRSLASLEGGLACIDLPPHPLMWDTFICATA